MIGLYIKGRPYDTGHALLLGHTYAIAILGVGYYGISFPLGYGIKF
jgi:hypothetical protein